MRQQTSKPRKEQNIVATSLKNGHGPTGHFLTESELVSKFQHVLAGCWASEAEDTALESDGMICGLALSRKMVLVSWSAPAVSFTKHITVIGGEHSCDQRVDQQPGIHPIDLSRNVQTGIANNEL
jgi:hypothetical protein